MSPRAVSSRLSGGQGRGVTQLASPRRKPGLLSERPALFQAQQPLLRLWKAPRDRVQIPRPSPTFYDVGTGPAPPRSRAGQSIASRPQLLSPGQRPRPFLGGGLPSHGTVPSFTECEGLPLETSFQPGLEPGGPAGLLLLLLLQSPSPSPTPSPSCRPSPPLPPPLPPYLPAPPPP